MLLLAHKIHVIHHAWGWVRVIDLYVKVLCVFIVSVFPATTAASTSDDWPQFRGPTGQGIAADSNLPLRWSQTKNVVWKVPIPGEGWSSPIVYQGSVYLTTALVDKQGHPTSLRAIRVDAVQGRTLWNREVFAPKRPYPKHNKNSHASPTPIVEDDRIYVHFGHMGTACLNVDGRVLWRQSSLKYDPYHGNGGSPILVGDKLIFNCDGAKDPFVAALKKHTGDVAWKATRKKTKAGNKFSFSTPLLIDEEGRKAVVSPGSGAVCAYNPDNGKEIWRVDYGSGFSVVPRPVYGHGIVFVATGFNKTNVYAVRVRGNGDVTDTHLVWKAESGAPRTPSMLLRGRELYFVSDNGKVSCVDAIMGKQHWQEKLRGSVSASPIAAGDRIYITTEKGKTFVIRADTEFETLAENDLGERTLASPAASGRALFIRTESYLYRIEQLQ